MDIRTSTRLVALFAVGLMAATAMAATSGDPLASLRFSDGKKHTAAEFSKQTVMLVYFCGHCPTAAATLANHIKPLYEFIESEKVPVTLVLATPDFGPADVLALNQSRNYHMDHALWASDPLNSNHISLNNIFQEFLIAPNGRMDHVSEKDEQLKKRFSSPAAGAFRFPIDGLTDARVKELWWTVERQRPDAVKNLVAAVKQKSPVQGEVQKVFDAVKASLTAREADLIAAPASIDTYEGLEALLGDAQSIELKLAVARYKELGRSKELKPELDARAAYVKCQDLLASPKPDAQAAGKAGLAQVAKKFPDTEYGKRSAQQ